MQPKNKNIFKRVERMMGGKNKSHQAGQGVSAEKVRDMRKFKPAGYVYPGSLLTKIPGD